MSSNYFISSVVVAVALLFSDIASASVTLRFGQTAVARATGFADNSGTPQNGMRWGIVVDAGGNGFADGFYDVFNNTVNGFLSAPGGNAAIAADDFFVTTGLLTSSATATGADAAVAAGAITLLSSIFSSYPVGVGVGDAFKIIWFETTPATGTYYGTMGNAAFTLPADGSDTSYASVFVGNDPNKPASLQFAPIPEPSRLMLLGLGLIGMIFRRRR